MMLKRNKIHWLRGGLLFFSVTLAVLPLVASAQLVTCTGINCDYCALLTTGERIIDFLLMVMFPIAAVIFVIGGFYIMTAGSSAARYQRGRDMIKSTIIGIAIVLLVWLVLDTIFQIVAPGAQGIVGPWNEIKCVK